MSSEIHFESATVDAPIDGCNSVEPIFTFVSQKQSECEFVRIQTKDRSEIDLNECEHFNSFKVNWDQSKLDWSFKLYCEAPVFLYKLGDFKPVNLAVLYINRCQVHQHIVAPTIPHAFNGFPVSSMRSNWRHWKQFRLENRLASTHLALGKQTGISSDINNTA